MTDIGTSTIGREDYPAFDFDVVSVAVREERSKTIVAATLSISDLSNTDLMELVAHHKLTIGMKMLDARARRPNGSERRGILARSPVNNDEIYATFTLTAEDFVEREPLLAKIDFLYEHDYWFDERRRSHFFISMINPLRVAEPRDVFDYYRAKTTGEI